MVGKILSMADFAHLHSLGLFASEPWRSPSRPFREGGPSAAYIARLGTLPSDAAKGVDPNSRESNSNLKEDDMKSTTTESAESVEAYQRSGSSPGTPRKGLSLGVMARSGDGPVSQTPECLPEAL
jgi:hypothetical protein